MTAPTDPKEWDARAYHRVSEPQFLWGQKVLARLPLRGDETVLDAGCGTGRLTALLLERLPRGKVIALDASSKMVEQARAHLEPRFPGKVEVLERDLLELGLEQGCDAIFSTATFHWVLDHDRLFANLRRALRPDGLLVAQCGGGKNLSRTREIAELIGRTGPFAPHLARFVPAWYYATAEDTERRLQEAGFRDVKVWLEAAPFPMADAPTYAEFVRAVVLRPYLAELPPELHERFVAEVTAAAGKDTEPYVLDYVRLNFDAKR